MPKDLNDSIKELIVWKRFRDFKELYQQMHEHHVSLHRKDRFPEFTSAKFFGRFDDKVIGERMQCSLRLLQFIGSQAHLYKNEIFIDFLMVNTLVLVTNSYTEKTYFIVIKGWGADRFSRS